MNRVQKRKKIFYVPGMISLVVIPALFIYYAKTFYNPTLVAMGINYYTPDLSEKYPDIFKPPLPPDRTYFTLTMTGNNGYDKFKLDISAILIKTMIIKNDSVCGIQIHFGDKAKYWTLVKSLDICDQEAKYWVYYEDNLAIYHVPDYSKGENIESWICGGTDFIERKPSRLEKLEVSLKTGWNSSQAIILGFIIFLLISIYKIVKP